MTTSVARLLHRSLPVLSAGMFACVVPPPLGLDQPDAGFDASPVFVSVRAPDGKELVHFMPNNVVAHQDAEWSITAYDADPGDTLIVQVFVDYTDVNPTSPRSTCTAAPTSDSSVERTLSCPIKAVCLDADVTNGNPHSLEFDIYDGPVINTPTMFRSVDSSRQMSTTAYTMTCLAPTS